MYSAKRERTVRADKEDGHQDVRDGLVALQGITTHYWA
jgi:hypothetical protein